MRQFLLGVAILVVASPVMASEPDEQHTGQVEEPSFDQRLEMRFDADSVARRLERHQPGRSVAEGRERNVVIGRDDPDLILPNVRQVETRSMFCKAANVSSVLDSSRGRTPSSVRTCFNYLYSGIAPNMFVVDEYDQAERKQRKEALRWRSEGCR